MSTIQVFESKTTETKVSPQNETQTIPMQIEEDIKGFDADDTGREITIIFQNLKYVSDPEHPELPRKEIREEVGRTTINSRCMRHSKFLMMAFEHDKNGTELPIAHNPKMSKLVFEWLSHWTESEPTGAIYEFDPETKQREKPLPTAGPGALKGQVNDWDYDFINRVCADGYMDLEELCFTADRFYDCELLKCLCRAMLATVSDSRSVDELLAWLCKDAESRGKPEQITYWNEHVRRLREEYTQKYNELEEKSRPVLKPEDNHQYFDTKFNLEMQFWGRQLEDEIEEDEKDEKSQEVSSTAVTVK